ncbi:hypothetical protein [Legionella spiritensis]|uniref:hypothetical protein n=1 Tax=Legionella spiritensis TaxID=452 RepID=UPI000F6BAE75|nr:hypothetical protein [Legionella spiritensis]VEG91860.1 Uncharacterised protein [Legionella spiritensis]
MNKSALIIRNVSSIVPSEIEAVLALCKFNLPLVVDEAAHVRVQELQTRLNNSEPINAGLLAVQDVRDYLYDSARNNAGHHLILHLDHHREDAEAYILAKLANLKNREHVQVFYLGGGHGGGHDGRVDDETSGLEKSSVQAIAARMSAREMTVGAMVFGSCYSAAFSNDFRPFLIEEGVMFGDSVECGHNGFDNLARWLGDPEDKPFFSDEEIKSYRIKISDIRAKFNEIAGIAPEIDDQHLLHAYADYTGEEPEILTIENVRLAMARNKPLNDAVLACKTDLFDGQLRQYSNDILALGAYPSTARLREVTIKYPLIRDYVDHIIATSVFTDNEEVFIEDLTRHIGEYEKEKQPGEEEIVTEGLFHYLADKFPDPHDRNYLAIAKYLCASAMCDRIGEYKDFLADDLQVYLEAYNPSDRYGPQIKEFPNIDELYQAVAVAMQRELVTSKVIGTPTETQMMELDSSTGKPPHTCHDAFALVKKVIDLVGSQPQITMTIESQVSHFNQASVMSEFNARFANAMVASQHYEEEVYLGDEPHPDEPAEHDVKEYSGQNALIAHFIAVKEQFGLFKEGVDQDVVLAIEEDEADVQPSYL